MGVSRIDYRDLLALESSCIPVAVYQFTDNRVVTLLVSDGFCELLGFHSHEDAVVVMDEDMYCDTHPDDVARISNAAYVFATAGGVYDVFYRTRDVTTSDRYRVVHAQGRHVYDENDVRYAVVWYTDEGPYKEDLEDCATGVLESAGAALAEQSRNRVGRYDALTGLPGTERFFELARGRQALLAQTGAQVTTLFVNVSGMRLYNHKHGYAEGNRLIRFVGHVLTSRFGDDSCGYLGQGCFAAITVAEGLDDTLRQIFVECHTLNGKPTRPIHVGVFVDKSGDVEVSAALDRARTACKTCAQTASSSYRYFSEAMLLEEEERQYIIDNLDTALEQGWVQIYCQPLVRAANGRVCDEEALARWIDPVKGFLSPARFIPVLEEARLVHKLDLHVLDLVLQKMRVLRDKGLYIVPSSINLSRSDFEMCDMVEEVVRRVDAAGVDHAMITLEITESTLGGNFEYMKEQVRRFHEQGFSVWMDDFGSEYSSLDNLQRIPFDLIKLDMGFMREFNENEKSRVILTELIKMAIALGVDTVAEGVETQEQVDFLREVGCSKMQGYYFSKPNSLAEILRRYETGTAIGFENPAESEYFSKLGRINLYDLASVARGKRESFGHYFDVLPMAVIESDDTKCTITRCNGTYKDFLAKIDDKAALDQWVVYPSRDHRVGSGFKHALQRCAVEGGLVVVDDRLPNGVIVHALVRRVAQNPVTGIAALAVAVLSIADEAERNGGVTFAHMARALAADYINLFYVDFDTDEYIEYKSDASVAELQIVRRGEDFFGKTKQEALSHIYEEDREAFSETVTKENIARALNEHGAFNATYRIAEKDGPVYVSIKAIRIAEGDSHVMLGVNNVDEQMRQH